MIIVTLPNRSGAPHESPSASYSSTVTSDCCDVTSCTWARFTGTGVSAGIMHLSPASSDTYNNKNTPAPQKLQLFVLFESIFCKTALFQLQRLYSLNGIWRWSLNCEQVRIGKHKIDTYPQIVSWHLHWQTQKNHKEIQVKSSSNVAYMQTYTLKFVHHLLVYTLH